MRGFCSLGRTRPPSSQAARSGCSVAIAQTKPASSRATLAAILLECLPRAPMRCQRLWRRSCACSRAGHDGGRLTGLTARQMRGARRPATLVVGRLDQQPAGVVVAGPSDRALPASLTRGGLGGHEAQVGHEGGRRLETREVADLGDQPDGGQRVDAAQAAQVPDQLAKVVVSGPLVDLALQRLDAAVEQVAGEQVVIEGRLLGGVLEGLAAEPLTGARGSSSCRAGAGRRAARTCRAAAAPGRDPDGRPGRARIRSRTASCPGLGTQTGAGHPALVEQRQLAGVALVGSRPGHCCAEARARERRRRSEGRRRAAAGRDRSRWGPAS